MTTTLVIFTGDYLTQIFKNEETPLGRFENFFNMPWHGKEWRTMEADEIGAFFMSVLPEMVKVRNDERTQVIAIFNSMNPFKRFWFRFWYKWQEPEVVTTKGLIREIRERCTHFASWAERAKGMNFYADSDMTPFVEKPRRVADMLAAHLHSLE